MAFPTLQDADTKTGTVTINNALWTLTYPTNVAAIKVTPTVALLH